MTENKEAALETLADLDESGSERSATPIATETDRQTIAAARERGTRDEWSAEVVHRLGSCDGLSLAEVDAELQAIGLESLEANAKQLSEAYRAASDHQVKSHAENVRQTGLAEMALRRAGLSLQWARERARLLALRRTALLSHR